MSSVTVVFLGQDPAPGSYRIGGGTDVAAIRIGDRLEPCDLGLPAGSIEHAGQRHTEEVLEPLRLQTETTRPFPQEDWAEQRAPQNEVRTEADEEPPVR